MNQEQLLVGFVLARTRLRTESDPDPVDSDDTVPRYRSADALLEVANLLSISWFRSRGKSE